MVEHKAELNLQGIVEMARVKINEFLGFVESVNECVAVNMKFFGGVGEVEPAAEERLDGFEKLVVAKQGR